MQSIRGEDKSMLLSLLLLLCLCYCLRIILSFWFPFLFKLTKSAFSCNGISCDYKEQAMYLVGRSNELNVGLEKEPIIQTELEQQRKLDLEIESFQNLVLQQMQQKEIEAIEHKKLLEIQAVQSSLQQNKEMEQKKEDIRVDLDLLEALDIPSLDPNIISLEQVNDNDIDIQPALNLPKIEQQQSIGVDC